MKTWMRGRAAGLVAVLCLFAGCSSEAPAEGPEIDGGRLVVDAGPEVDAGALPDAGTQADAGTPADAGAPSSDAGVVADGGIWDQSNWDEASWQ